MDNNIVDKRTAGKWFISDDNHGRYLVIKAEPNKAVAVCFERGKEHGEANAAFICKAVNNYDSLLQALKDIQKVTNNYTIRILAARAIKKAEE